MQLQTARVVKVIYPLYIKDYSQIKLSFHSGIISHIYSQLCSSLSDFTGLLLGSYKICTDMKSSDAHSNLEHNVLLMNVDNVIFIYEKNYGKKIEKLIGKIYENYSNNVILGI
jgi:hypothetical protein